MNPALLQANLGKVLLRTNFPSAGLITQTIRVLKDISNIQLPPEPTTCCMSGCANCVWIEYADKLAKLLDGNTDEAREIVLKKIQDPNLRMFLQTELKLKMGQLPPSNTSPKDKPQPNK